jgi:hypothetical protein
MLFSGKQMANDYYKYTIIFKVTLYDENTDFIIFYIFVDLYSEAGDLSIAASFFPKY